MKVNPVYLYLKEKKWATPWEKGGTIPINLASSYKQKERKGIFTPDETIIHNSPIDLNTEFFPFHFIKKPKKDGFKSLTFIGCSKNGKPIQDLKNVTYYVEDGLILSFSTTYKIEIQTRLEKKTCVKIHDIFVLKEIIDKQLTCKSILKEVNYTQNHERNHFLKSKEDEWMKEVRLFWNIKKKKNIILPKGITEEMGTYN